MSTGSSKNETNTTVWFFESATAENGSCHLSPDGLEHIATHKYVSGKYTFLDNFLNPFWTYLTNLLPMSLAPNSVTTIGGIHCMTAYILLWYHSPQFDDNVPGWLIFLGGYCSIAYYTLDCMDGKQARRTNTSSPLGQLFDHGFDCINTLIYVSLTATLMMCGRTKSYFLIQGLVQFSFFFAQWEEYNTGYLPHAAGNFGVTETNYGIGMIALFNSFIDREYIWKSRLQEIAPAVVANVLPPSVAEMQMRYLTAAGVGIFMPIMIFISLKRTMRHKNVCTASARISALSKLLTPLLVSATPFFLPASIIESNTRYLSIATGLLSCLLTIKLICFSMAKMAYAACQVEAIPYFVICAWIRMDENITERGSTFILGALCLWNGFRLLKWTKGTIDQICARLDIYCFSIKQKAE